MHRQIYTDTSCLVINGFFSMFPRESLYEPSWELCMANLWWNATFLGGGSSFCTIQEYLGSTEKKKRLKY